MPLVLFVLDRQQDKKRGTKEEMDLFLSIMIDSKKGDEMYVVLHVVADDVLICILVYQTAGEWLNQLRIIN